MEANTGIGAGYRRSSVDVMISSRVIEILRKVNSKGLRRIQLEKGLLIEQNRKKDSIYGRYYRDSGDMIAWYIPDRGGRWVLVVSSYESLNDLMIYASKEKIILDTNIINGI